MKKIINIIVVAACVASMSCKVGKGCPSSGKSVGAERVLGADAKTLKALKKAPKFRA